MKMMHRTSLSDCRRNANWSGYLNIGWEWEPSRYWSAAWHSGCVWSASGEDYESNSFVPESHIP